MEIERKFYDFPQTAASSTTPQAYVPETAGQITQICQPTLGDGVSNLTGQQIVVRSILLRLFLVAHSTGTSSSPFYYNNAHRVILFLDKDSHSTPPAVTDVLQYANYLSPLADNNKIRFKVIHDRLYSLGNSPDTQVDKMFRKSKRLITTYNNTANNTLNDPLQNQYYILIISQNATDEDPAIYWTTRTRYVDA